MVKTGNNSKGELKHQITYLGEFFGYHSLAKISSADFDTMQSTNLKIFSYWYKYSEENPKWNIEHFDKVLTLETVVLIKNSSQWPIYIIDSVDKATLSCYTLTVLAHSFSYGWQNSKSFLGNVRFYSSLLGSSNP